MEKQTPHRNACRFLWPERLGGFSETKERNGFGGTYQRELIQGQLECSSNSTKYKGRQARERLTLELGECERVDNGPGTEL